MVSTLRGQRVPLTLVLLATGAVISAMIASSAAAAPGTDNEGGNPTLREQLEAASRGFLDAQAALENSRKRQAELTQQLQTAETRLPQLTAQAGQIASTAYRTGGLRTASALLDSPSPDTFVDRATVINLLASRNDRQLRELNKLHQDLAAAKAAIDAEVKNQEQQLAVMAKKKQDAERALASVGGQATGGHVTSSSPRATAAPRRADGSWPPESCSLNDPTTSGCITPRTLHALNQAKAAGFTRYVSCYRPGGSGEHPKGRACDFAAAQSGFGGVATGGDRTYGNNLAAYFVRNANQLAVLYVIWYRQIWIPSSGWRAYNGGGDPSSDHTNHVHLSVY